MIKKQKGTRDFYPEDKRIQNYIFSKWKKIAELYGYEEIDGPILEAQELYVKSGQEIPEQMYVLTDKSGRKLAIRPELTPTIARMVSQNSSLTKPIKWYTISRCLRYERAQLGRTREFFQFNLDCLGSNTQESYAEVLVSLVKIVKELCLTDKEVVLRINNRKLMNSIFEFLKIKKQEDILRLIDKKNKMDGKEFKLALKDLKITDRQIFDLLKFLDYKKLTDFNKYKLNSEGKKAIDELKELFSLLELYKVNNYCELDLSVVRGMDYYTGTVFELTDKKMELRSIAGGGIYENLVKDMSKLEIPGIGYGMGDVVLGVLLKKLGKLPDLKKNVDYYIAPINKKMIGKAIEVSEKLRKKYNVEIDLMNRSLGKQLNYANSINAKKVVIIGEKDLKENKVTIRDMKSGKEGKVSIDSI